MGKGFNLRTDAETIAVSRADDGRFRKLAAASAEKLGREMERGTLLNDVMRAEMVPDRDVGTGAPKNVARPGQPKAPVYPDSIPWPAATVGKTPFKLKGGA